jgi:tetratricopeptide (TPR) repeat protein
MLAKDPARRYADLAAFLDDMNKFRQGGAPRDIAAESFLQSVSTPRFLIPAMFIFLVMITAGFLVLLNIGKPETATTGGTPLASLAVVYFDNKSGDKQLDNWRDALPELLTTDLSQSRYLRVLRSDQLYGIYKQLNLLEAERYTEQDLQSIARQGGVDHIVKGSYIKAGDHLVITAMLIHADSGETITSLSLQAAGEREIFAKVDQLTREIKGKLNIAPEQLASDIDKEVETISTQSAEALSLYLQGRHHHYEGHFRESIRSMERALAYDPDFAMAYRSMTWSYYHLGLLSEQMTCLRKAMELSDNLPTLERYVIQGDYYRFNRPPGETRDRALESIQKALRLYPDNPLANGKLIELCADVEDWDRAIDRFELMKGKNLTSHFDYHYISIYYCAKGLPEKAVENLQYYLEHVADSYVIRCTLALVYANTHQFDLALSEIERAQSPDAITDWISSHKAAIHLFRGEFAEAENTCQRLLAEEDIATRLAGRKMYGLLYLLQGRLAEAEAQLREGKTAAARLGLQWDQSRFASQLGYIHLISGGYPAALAEFEDELEIYREFGWFERKIRARYLKALTRLEQQSSAGSPAAEVDLRAWVDNALNKKFERYYDNYLGRKELARGHVATAVAHFDRALASLPH